MASGRIVIEGFMPALDLNGAPVPGAKLTFKQNRTSTLAAVYTDFELSVPHTNPVVADSSGQFASIFADANDLYTVVIEDGDGVPVGVGSLDDVRAIGKPGGGEFALGYDDADTRTIEDRFQEMPVSVGEFESLVVAGVGGLPDDWTAAIQAALDADRNVYLPGRVGGYYVKDELVFRSAGNMLVGDGVTESYLVIDRDFDMASLGVIRIPNGADESQAGFSDIGFVFHQPGDNYISAIAVSAGGTGYTSIPTVTITGGGGSGATARAVLTAGAVSSIVITRNGTGYATAPTVTITGGGGSGATAGTVTRVASVVRANVVQYPYALSARDVSRMLLGNLRITGGYKGLDLRDNTGGLMGGRWEIGCINEGITGGDATGGTPALDFWHIDTIHCWPFGWQTGTNYTTYRDGSTIAARFGRIDGLQVKDFSTFTGRIITEAGSAEGPFGTFGSLQQDGRYSRLEFGAGRMAVGSFYGTTDQAGDYKILVTAGHLNVGAWWAASSAASGSTPVFSCTGGYLGMNGGLSAGSFTGQAVFNVGSGGELHVADSTFIGINNTTRTVGVITQSGTGVLSAVGNVFQAIGTGSGSAITIGADSTQAVVRSNTYGGWSLTLPSDPAGGYQGNYDQAIRRTRSIAAADPLPLLSTDEYVVVTGNTSFGTIQTTKLGQEVTLLFTGTPVLANSPGNNEYAGLETIQARNGLVLKLVMTLTGWKEVNRTVNLAAAGWATTTPVPTASSGAFTTVASALDSKVDAYGMLEFTITVTVTTAGTAAGQIQVAMPFAADKAVGFAGVISGTDIACSARMAAGSTTLIITKYDGTFAGASGAVIVVTGRYRADV